MSEREFEQDLFQANHLEASEGTENQKESNGPVSFEQAMEQLENIVDQLEAGEVPLEQAIELFQEGMQLSKTCHQKLEQIEQKVEILLKENDEFVRRDFRVEGEQG